MTIFTNLRTGMIGLAAGAGLVLASQAASAAIVLDGWNLNLSVANGLTAGATTYTGLGGSNATNIDHAGLQGFSQIDQVVTGGVALGNTFTDSGFLGMNNYFTEGSAFPTLFNLGNEGNSLYIRFDNLTGTLLANGNITFDSGAGTVGLYLDSAVDGLAGSEALLLASYDVVSPSGGSNLDFFGGTAANSTVDVTLKQTAGIAGLFTDSNGDEVSIDWNLHLVNVDSLLDPNFSPNPDNSGIDGFGNGISKIYVQNAGQYNVATIPEPASLALMGIGLAGIGALHRRRRKASA